MELKKIYKVMSVAMLFTTIGQVSYPLLSETAVQAQEVVANSFDIETSLTQGEVDDADGIVNYDPSKSEEVVEFEKINNDSIEKEVIEEEKTNKEAGSDIYNRAMSIDYNNLTQEDQDFLASLTKEQISSGFNQYVLASTTSSTSDDSLSSNNICEASGFVTSGNKYYQGGECEVGIDNPHSDGPYYIYYDPSTPDDFENYIGRLSDVTSTYEVGRLAYEANPLLVKEGGDVGEICPYFSERFMHGNIGDNVPTNERRDSGCDYPYPLMGGAGGLFSTFGLSAVAITDEDGTVLPVGATEITQDMVGHKYEVTYGVYVTPQMMANPVFNAFTNMYGNACNPGMNAYFCQNPRGAFQVGDVLNSGGTLTLEVVDEKQLMTANDIVVSEAFAPRSDAQVISMSNAHFTEPENIVDRNNVDHGGDVYSVGDVEYTIDTGDYDYNNPTLGTHMVEITAVSPTTGFETSCVITIEVANYFEGNNESGILLANTPVVMDNNEES